MVRVLFQTLLIAYLWVHSLPSLAAFGIVSESSNTSTGTETSTLPTTQSATASSSPMTLSSNRGLGHVGTTSPATTVETRTDTQSATGTSASGTKFVSLSFQQHQMGSSSSSLKSADTSTSTTPGESTLSPTGFGNLVKNFSTPKALSSSSFTVSPKGFNFGTVSTGATQSDTNTQTATSSQI